MITTKPGVSIRGVRAELLFALPICEGIFMRAEAATCRVTSVMDGVHKAGSLHYAGLAMDLGIKDVIPDRREIVVGQLVRALSPLGFDVLWEGRGTPNEHVHVEYDPRQMNTAPPVAGEV